MLTIRRRGVSQINAIGVIVTDDGVLLDIGGAAVRAFPARFCSRRYLLDRATDSARKSAR